MEAKRSGKGTFKRKACHVIHKIKRKCQVIHRIVLKFFFKERLARLCTLHKTF